ncbi:hypothetical protein ACFL1P_00765 [Patescibacteria group bacterium]
MLTVNRVPENPLLSPNPSHSWESVAAFNGSVIKNKQMYHMVYRALSDDTPHFLGKTLRISTVGYTKSTDGLHFSQTKQLIKPEYDWEKYGCEDPRITRINNSYYIFYTALSMYPFAAPGIKVAVALTKDLKTIDYKHLVTPFNAKAMCMFPETINGKHVAILSCHTDMPPVKLALISFDTPEQIWSKSFWQKWYRQIDAHTISLVQSAHDHAEIGAQPVKTDDGWIILYSYIRNYMSNRKLFAIQAALLDRNNPQKIISTIDSPLLIPQKQYELYGDVPNVIFPTGAVMNSSHITLYYGAADTTVCAATIPTSNLLQQLKKNAKRTPKIIKTQTLQAQRSKNNPILSPTKHIWESKATFNPAAIYIQNSIHLVYRAMSKYDTSTLGHATSKDGVTISSRSDSPIYEPRESFEKKMSPGNSGCEDPRLTHIGNTIYMCYTAYTGTGATRVAITSIAEDTFLEKKWDWSTPVLITSQEENNKDVSLFSQKIRDKYVFIHRIDPYIWIDYTNDLSFQNNYLKGMIIASPRIDKWDSEKIGANGPPIKTSKGWLLFYHGISLIDRKYRIGAMLLDLEHPEHVVSRLDDPILEPATDYEYTGIRPGTVFSNGHIVKKDTIYIYYGAGDTVTGVATISLSSLLNVLA